MAAKKRDQGWSVGFTEGYLACLFAFTGHHDGADVEFVEAVSAGGPSQLLAHARRTDDIVLPHLRKAVAAIRERRTLRRRGAKA